MVERKQRLFKTKKIIMKKECECTDECLGYLTKECKRIEEPKQETLEEVVAKKLYPLNDGFQIMDIDISEELQLAFTNGAKWQQERSYSEEEVFVLLNAFNKHTLKLQSLKLGNSFDVKEWFKQFKKK